MLVDIIIKFDAALDRVLPLELQGRAEILHFLKTHEQKEKCVTRLCGEVMRAEKDTRFKMAGAEFELMIEEMAKLFAKCAIEAKIEEQTSSAEKWRRSIQGSEYDELRSCILEKDTDEEIGNAKPIGGDP